MAPFFEIKPPAGTVSRISVNARALESRVKAGSQWENAIPLGLFRVPHLFLAFGFIPLSFHIAYYVAYVMNSPGYFPLIKRLTSITLLRDLSNCSMYRKR